MKYDRTVLALKNIKDNIQNKVNENPIDYIVNNEIDIHYIINDFIKQLKRETKFVWIDNEDLKNRITSTDIKITRIKNGFVLNDNESEFIIKNNINYCDYFFDKPTCSLNIKIHVSVKGDISYWKHYMHGIKFGYIVSIDLAPLSVVLTLSK